MRNGLAKGDKQGLLYWWLPIHLEKWLKMPLLPKYFQIYSELFSDSVLSVLIGHHNYHIIEHALQIFDDKCAKVVARHAANWKHLIVVWLKDLLYSPVPAGEFGDNRYCISVLSGTKVKADYLKDKEHIQLDFKKAWQNSSDEKRQYILDLYGITREDIRF